MTTGHEVADMAPTMKVLSTIVVFEVRLRESERTKRGHESEEADEGLSE